MQEMGFNEQWVALTVQKDGTIFPEPSRAKHDQIIVRRIKRAGPGGLYCIFNITKMYLCYVELKRTEVAPRKSICMGRCDYDKCREWGGRVCLHIRAAVKRHVFLKRMLGDGFDSDKIGPMDETARAVLAGIMANNNLKQV